MALSNKTVSSNSGSGIRTPTIRQALVLTLLIASVQTKVDLTEDRDLTGCSVQLNSYIFNLNGLKKSS